MPGMMDTVLNLGLNDEVVTSLGARRGEQFAAIYGYLLMSTVVFGCLLLLRLSMVAV